MTKNRIVQLRKSRGLTQRALAELVGTSQQQIQRIEAGVQGVRLELATRIALALGGELRDIFPSLVAPLKRKSGKAPSQNSAAAQDSFAEIGIDADPAQWTVKFFASNGHIFLYSVSSGEKSRLERLVRAGEGDFIVFTSASHRVALNTKKIAATQFLFDFGVIDSSENIEEDFKISLHLSAAKEPFVFDVEPDQLPLEDDDDVSQSQLQNMFVTLGLGLDDEIVWFDDIDGERVYIRPTEMMLIEVPLICCEPALWKASFDGFLEDEEAAKSPSSSGKVGQ
jgi:transcriptional regulator with XRE-family HTH domain